MNLTKIRHKPIREGEREGDVERDREGDEKKEPPCLGIALFLFIFPIKII